MSDERTPIVTHVEKQGGVLFDVYCGTQFARVNCTLTVDSTVLNIWDCCRHLGRIALKPDPVAAAVEKERERLKATVTTTMADLGLRCHGPSLLAAIDAKPEPVSEYERGRRDGTVGAKRRLRLALLGAGCPAKLLDVLNAQEPTDA